MKQDKSSNSYSELIIGFLSVPLTTSNHVFDWIFYQLLPRLVPLFFNVVAISSLYWTLKAEWVPKKSHHTFSGPGLSGALLAFCAKSQSDMWSSCFLATCYHIWIISSLCRTQDGHAYFFRIHRMCYASLHLFFGVEKLFVLHFCFFNFWSYVFNKFNKQISTDISNTGIIKIFLKQMFV